ncbi:hypothetical protein L6164_035119 [Bauhinia variegata]|uniref:Uncharacterized protein n=1 Tax=Bauhinia variegata TaxID=167791 RepID=A0ACB9KXL9_BAUVA|nr:hypothetical protein L6164_035119 [Bauhinia variegata]
MRTTSVIIIFWILVSYPNFQNKVALSQTLSSAFSSHGEWHLLYASIGISAMHMQVLSNNKVIIFDRTDFGPSNLTLPGGRCRVDPLDTALKVDCTAHSVLYNIASNVFRPLMVHTDTWCSSGSVLPNGTFVQTGGFNDGERNIRVFNPCFDETCDWLEFHNYLSERRWYSTNQILPDGRIIIVGGRRQFNYEFFPSSSDNPSSPRPTFFLSFLQETTDSNENNLYPFVLLLPDGNLFIFANTRSISFDYKRNLFVKEFPRIPGGDPRNYPSTGSAVLLPLDENKDMEAEILICGGAPQVSFWNAVKGTFMLALSTCGRLKVTDQNPNWVMENMPIPRVMGDMLILPTGDVIIINGARLGTAGWDNGREPVLTPVIYWSSPRDPNWRFTVMAAASRPRVYHSSAVLLTDGRVVVGGSNPQMNYTFSGVEYPTDLSLEAFSPPYLSPEFDITRPTIMYFTGDFVGYGEYCYVTFTVRKFVSASELSVRLVAPSFTTHSFAMNQRMVVLKLIGVTYVRGETYYATVAGPSTPEIAPPGYYMLFVVNSGAPSSGLWVKVH